MSILRKNMVFVVTALIVLALFVVFVVPVLAAVGTDQADYSPGSVVTVSGDNSDNAGYVAGETVHVDVSGPNGYAAACEATADDAGAWSCQVILAGDESAVGDYSYTATGQTSGVSQSGTFTDKPPSAPPADLNINLNNDTAEEGEDCPGDGLAYWHFVVSPNDGTSHFIRFQLNLGDGVHDITVFVKNKGQEDNVFVAVPVGYTLTSLDKAGSTADIHWDGGSGNQPNKFQLSHVCPGAGIPEAESPTVSKDANGSYDNTYYWTIAKDVNPTVVKQIGGMATFNYIVTVSHGDGQISNVKVDGTITVNNPNSTDVTLGSITDELDGTTCSVDTSGGLTVGPGDTTFPYTCDLDNNLPTGDVSNKVTVMWSEQTLSDGSHLAAGSAEFTTGAVSFTVNEIDERVTVNDSNPEGPQNVQVCVDDLNPTTFNYSKTIPVPQWDCQLYDNTATFTTNDTGATGSASKTVRVCGPAKTGALTMGFWQNKNGQAIITNNCGGTSGTSLYTFLTGYNPFKDLTKPACSDIAKYVTNVIKAANASGASMNAMLKAQMLATALDVYFSDLALGGNKINAPVPIGGVEIDLTLICTDLTCIAFEDSNSVFGGTPKTVLEMLANAASQSNTGGSMWYGNVKATQELAKDAFDAINNQKVFIP